MTLSSPNEQLVLSAVFTVAVFSSRWRHHSALRSCRQLWRGFYRGLFCRRRWLVPPNLHHPIQSSSFREPVSAGVPRLSFEAPQHQRCYSHFNLPSSPNTSVDLATRSTTFKLILRQSLRFSFAFFKLPKREFDHALGLELNLVTLRL